MTVRLEGMAGLFVLLVVSTLTRADVKMKSNSITNKEENILYLKWILKEREEGREETREDDKLSYTLPHLLCMYMLMAVVIITGNMAARAKKFSKESAMKLAQGVAVVLSWQLNFSWKYYQND